MKHVEKAAFINIIDYVKKEQKALSLPSFRDTDALVFAQLSYLDFSVFKNGMTLSKMGERADEAAAKSHAKTNNRDLLLAVAGSRRFKEVKVIRYVCETNLLFEMQFSATTFVINRRLIFVAFRGTDDTINGWKEDFNMVFIDEIPAQSRASAYLKSATSHYRFHKVIVGGHSKGGNLAVYSAMKQSRSLRQRISRVYSLDGPEFRDEISTSHEYTTLLPKVIKIVPESSIIGMIMQSGSYYYIVKSEGTLLAQHNLYNWHVDIELGDLVHQSALSKSSERIKSSLYYWLNGFTIEDRQIIIDAFFDMLSASNCMTLSEFSDNLMANIKIIYGEYREADDHTKKLLRRTLFNLAKYLIMSYFQKTDKPRVPKTKVDKKKANELSEEA